MRIVVIASLALVLLSSAAEARVVRLRIERREVVLNGRAFGAAGAYEKLVGRSTSVSTRQPAQRHHRGSEAGAAERAREVEASADFYMLKPVDPRRGNGRLFYEVGNRGGKAMLSTFQKASGSPIPRPRSSSATAR